MTNSSRKYLTVYSEAQATSTLKAAAAAGGLSVGPAGGPPSVRPLASDRRQPTKMQASESTENSQAIRMCVADSIPSHADAWARISATT